MPIDLGKLTTEQTLELAKDCFVNLPEEQQIEFLRYAKGEVGDMMAEVAEEENDA